MSHSLIPHTTTIIISVGMQYMRCSSKLCKWIGVKTEQGSFFLDVERGAAKYGIRGALYLLCRGLGCWCGIKIVTWVHHGDVSWRCTFNMACQIWLARVYVDKTLGLQVGKKWCDFYASISIEIDIYSPPPLRACEIPRRHPLPVLASSGCY